MSLGKTVLRIRHAKKLTQRSVGRRAGLATSYLSRIENGHLQPTMPTLQKIADAMGVSMAEVFEVQQGTQAPAAHQCPVSTSGNCIGEQIRSGRGRRPANGGVNYGPDELRLLRMADFIVLQGTKETRDALGIVLDALMERTRRPPRPAAAP